MGTASDTLRHARPTRGEYLRMPKGTGLYDVTVFKGDLLLET